MEPGLREALRQGTYSWTQPLYALFQMVANFVITPLCDNDNFDPRQFVSRYKLFSILQVQSGEKGQLAWYKLANNSLKHKSSRIDREAAFPKLAWINVIGANLG